MSRSLTVWISPLEAPPSLQAAVDIAKAQAASISTQTRVYSPNLLLPTHYGPYPQSQCHQNLPPDLLVDTPEDIVAIRENIEAQGVGFGAWGVPLNNGAARLAASHAAYAGYYVSNFEPTSAFWAPGDSAAEIDQYWSDFWNSLPDQGALSGNVGVTVVPNSWGFGAFRGSLTNLLGGANLVLMEAYGGPNTPEYPYPDLWPVPSASSLRALDRTGTAMACILSNLNLQAQASQASRIGAGNIHSWFAR